MCAISMEAKNLTEVEPLKNGLAGATTKTNNKVDLVKYFPKSLKPKILEYAVKRLNQGCSEQGVKSYLYSLRSLVQSGADLHDPESVKAAVYRKKVSNRTKDCLISVYNSFLKFLGGSWEKPKYLYSQKQPFIPLRSEIDQLILGCSRTVSAFLLICKETGARKGEVARLKWSNVDFKRNIISVNDPEKGSNSRQIKVSSKCISHINRLRRKSDRIFNISSIERILQTTQKSCSKNL